jgi:hypothetical protein
MLYRCRPLPAPAGHKAKASRFLSASEIHTMPTKKNAKEASAEAKWFAALGTPIRLSIVRALADAEKSVKEIAVLSGWALRPCAPRSRRWKAQG